MLFRNKPLLFGFFLFFSQNVCKKRTKMRNYTETTEFIPGTVRWPITSGCDLCLSAHQLQAQHHWEPDLYHLDTEGCPTPDPRALLPQEFLHIRSVINTVTIPKFLTTIITRDKTISFNDCMAQIFYFFSFSWESLSLPSGCRVLWLLPCHLQITALHDHHES